MKDRCPLERLWLSSWGQLAARLAAAPPGAAAAPGPAASRDASAQGLWGFGVRGPPSWTPARPRGQDDVMTAMRPMVRWALPGGLVAAVLATIALGPLVQAGAAGEVPEPGAGALLADLLGAGPQGVSGTVVTRVDLGLPLLPAGLGGAAEGSWAALLTGDSTLRVWAGPGGVRVALLGVLAESDLVIGDADAWLWSSPDATVTHLGPANLAGGDGGIDEGADPSGGEHLQPGRDALPGVDRHPPAGAAGQVRGPEVCDGGIRTGPEPRIGVADHQVGLREHPQQRHPDTAGSGPDPKGAVPGQQGRPRSFGSAAETGRKQGQPQVDPRDD